MKIVRTVPVYYPYVTGPTNQGAKISSYLESEGYSSPVHTSRAGAEDRPIQEMIDNVQVTRYNNYGKFLPHRVHPKFVSSILKEDFDIIHSHCYRNFLSEFSSRVCSWKKKPFILHNHGTFTGHEKFMEQKPKSYQVYDIATRKTCIKIADAVIVSSEQEYKEAIRYGVEEKKVKIIPAGKYVKDYRAIRPEKPEDHTRLLFVGRLSRDRRVEVVIKAMERLDDNIHLRIVGGEEKRSGFSKGGYIEELYDLCEKLNLRSRVEFVGPKYEDELVQEYRNAHIFVYPSEWENFGQTMLEAAAAEVPVIATREGVANDIIKEGKTGYTVDYNDPDMIVEKVNLALNQDLEKMGERIGKIAKEKYDWENILPKYTNLYQEII